MKRALLISIILFFSLTAFCKNDKLLALKKMIAEDKGKNKKTLNLETLNKSLDKVTNSKLSYSQRRKVYDNLWKDLESSKKEYLIDKINPELLKTYPKDIDLRIIVAWNYKKIAWSGGEIVNGKFIRGRGKYRERVSNSENDRLCALKILIPLFQSNEGDKKQQSRIREFLFDVIWSGNYGRRRPFSLLKKLTNLKTGKLEHLYDDKLEFDYGEGGHNQIPFLNGKAYFFQIPKNFEAAKSDAERLLYLTNYEECAYEWFSLIGRLYYNTYDEMEVHSFKSEIDRKPIVNESELKRLAADEILVLYKNKVIKIHLPSQYNYIAYAKRDENYGELGHIYKARGRIDEAALMYKKQAETDKRFLDDYQRLIKAELNIGDCKTFLTGQPVEISVKYKNFYTINFTLQQLDANKIYKDLLVNKNKDYTLQEVIYHQIRKYKSKYFLKTAGAWNVKLKKTLIPQSKIFPLKIDNKKAGIYILEVRAKSKTEGNSYRLLKIPIVIKSLACMTFARGTGDSNIFVVDPLNGQAYKNFKVQIDTVLPRRLRVKGIKGKRKIYQAKNYHAQIKGVNKYLSYCKITTPDGKSTFFPFYSGWREEIINTVDHSKRAALALDQTSYTQGEKVKFKVWVVDPKSKPTKFIPNKPVEMTIERVHHSRKKSKQIFKKTFVSSKNGSFAGEYRIPENIESGRYAIQVLNARVKFNLMRYEKDKCSLKIKPSKKYLYSGQAVSFNIAARYLSGKPIKGYNIEYTIKRRSFYDEYSFANAWEYNSGMYKKFDYNPEYSRRAHVRNVLKGTETSDSNGIIKVYFDTKKEPLRYQQTNMTYEISARIYDDSKKLLVRKSAEVNVFANPYSSKCWIESGYCLVGKPVEIFNEVHNYIGEKFSGKGKLRILKFKDKKFICTEEFSLDIKNKNIISRKYTFKEPGTYKIEFILKDQKGFDVISSTARHVFTQNLICMTPRSYKFPKLAFMTYKRVYKVGDKVPVIVCSNKPDIKGILLLIKINQKNMQIKRVNLKNGISSFLIDIAKNDNPDIAIKALKFFGSGFTEFDSNLEISESERRIYIKVTTEKDLIVAGQYINAELTALDEHNKPVQGSATVSIYDNTLRAWQYNRSIFGQLYNNRTYYFSKSIKHYKTKYREDGSDDNESFFPFLYGLKKNDTVNEKHLPGNLGKGDCGCFPKKLLVAPNFTKKTYWNTNVMLDKNGTAKIKFKTPGYSTNWNIKAFVVDKKVQVGEGTTMVRTVEP
jgi:MG2 domain